MKPGWKILCTTRLARELGLHTCCLGLCSAEFKVRTGSGSPRSLGGAAGGSPEDSTQGGPTAPDSSVFRKQSA